VRQVSNKPRVVTPDAPRRKQPKRKKERKKQEQIWWIGVGPSSSSRGPSQTTSPAVRSTKSSRDVVEKTKKRECSHLSWSLFLSVFLVGFPSFFFLSFSLTFRSLPGDPVVVVGTGEPDWIINDHSRSGEREQEEPRDGKDNYTT
jgi:hypothetical protein